MWHEPRLNEDFRTRPGKALLNCVERNNLRIHNREPTRITDHSATVLDPCISVVSNLVSDTEILPPVASSDHCVLVYNCNIRIEKPGFLI